MEENVKPLVGFVLYVLRGSLTIFYGNYLAAVSGKNKNMLKDWKGTEAQKRYWQSLKGKFMPWTGKQRTEEHKKHLSEALKGRKPSFTAWKKGYQASKGTRIKAAEANRGDKNIHWKGDNVGYRALHDWVYRYKGKPNRCSKCGTTTARNFEWANISGLYKRELNAWTRLCRSCHVRQDNIAKKCWITRRGE